MSVRRFVRVALTLGLLVVVCLPARAQWPSVGASESDVVSWLRTRCDSLDELVVSPTRHPLVAGEESRHRCRGLSVDGAEAVELVLDDGRLVMMEWVGRGLDERALGATADDSPTSYAGLLVFPKSGFAVTLERDHAWRFEPDEIHVHPFVARSAWLEGSDDADVWPEPDVALPVWLELGRPLEAVERDLRARCRRIEVRPIDPPTLPSQPVDQTQIDCFGTIWAGFERKIEAVFADGRLALAWVLTSRAEEPRLLRWLGRAAVSPVECSERWCVIESGRVALRRDLPELLVVSPAESTLIGR